MVLGNATILLTGLVLLVKGSDYFVKAASTIAKKLGISEFVIGLTLVAGGTSIPELASSIAASLQQASGIVIGNVVGSNTANIALVVGLAATLSPVKTAPEMLRRDGYIMLFAALLFFAFAFAFNEALSRLEAAVFVMLYVAYVFFLFEEIPTNKGRFYFKEFITYFVKFEYINSMKQKINSASRNRDSNLSEEQSLARKGLRRDFLNLVAGSLGVILGARYFVEQSIFFAQLLEIPDTVIGTTLVAVGTSLPELMVTISAARNGYGSIALGNVIGSNITNIFLILGVSGLLFPIAIEEISIFLTAPFMIFISTVLLVFIATGWEIKRWEGIALTVFYVAFLAVLLHMT